MFVSSFSSCFSSHRSWSHFKLTPYLPYPETAKFFLVQDLHPKRKTHMWTFLWPSWSPAGKKMQAVRHCSAIQHLQTSPQWGKDKIVIHAVYTFSSCNLANTGISTSVNITAFPTTQPGHGRAYVLGVSHWYRVSHCIFVDVVTRARLTWWSLSVPLLHFYFAEWLLFTAESRIPYSQRVSPAIKVALACVY